jgi:cell division protein FtsL
MNKPVPETVHPPDPKSGESDRFKIYGGTMGNGAPAGLAVDASYAPSRELITPRPRKIIRRKVSPFNIVLLLLAAAVFIVLYIGNIIAVDQLSNEINALETQHQRILMEQEVHKAQINRLSSLERIRQRAEEELGLQNPKEPPVWLNVDQQKVREVEEALERSVQ